MTETPCRGHDAEGPMPQHDPETIYGVPGSLILRCRRCGDNLSDPIRVTTMSSPPQEVTCLDCGSHNISYAYLLGQPLVVRMFSKQPPT